MPRGLYQSKVTSSLAAMQRPGHRGDNCKMVYLHPQHRTFRRFRGRAWNKRKSTKLTANQSAVLHDFPILEPSKNWLLFLKGLEVCKLIPQYTMIFCLESLGICKIVPQNHDFRSLDGSSHTSRSCHRHVQYFDAHFSVVEYSVAYFFFIFHLAPQGYVSIRSQGAEEFLLNE